MPETVPLSRDRKPLPDAVKLSLSMRAQPWVWMLIAVGALVVHVPEITIGAIIMSQLARMENAAQQRALIVAWWAEQLATTLSRYGEQQ